MTELFACDVCGTVDMFIFAYPEIQQEKWSTLKECLCTQCQLGEWHDQFDKSPYDPERDIVLNRANPLGLG